MKRKAIVLDQDIHQKTLILLDVQNASKILPYLFENSVSAEFLDIRNILKQNLRNRDKYCKCDVNSKASRVFEMRFTNNQRNDRIYCLEVSTNKQRLIIMSELFIGKKSQEIPKKIKGRIETIGGFEYEIE